MEKIVFLLIIITIKTVLTKGLSLLICLLSFFIKGKSIHFSAEQWDTYFKDMKENFVLKYFKIVYTISTLLSSFVAYLLFCLANFKYPLVLTIILLICSFIFTWINYKRKIREKLITTCEKIRESCDNE